MQYLRLPLILFLFGALTQAAYAHSADDCCAGVDPEFFDDPFDEKDLRTPETDSRYILDLCRVVRFKDRGRTVSLRCRFPDSRKPNSILRSAITNQSKERVVVGSNLVCVLERKVRNSVYKVKFCTSVLTSE
jgi:hypothetical protein